MVILVHFTEKQQNGYGIKILTTDNDDNDLVMKFCRQDTTNENWEKDWFQRIVISLTPHCMHAQINHLCDQTINDHISIFGSAGVIEHEIEYGLNIPHEIIRQENFD